MLYSFGSNYWRDAHRSGDANGDASASNLVHLEATTTDWGNTTVPMPFWDVIRFLSARNALYDVRMLPDGELREDDFDEKVLEPYPMIVLPDCRKLTERQADMIFEYAEKGKKILVYGRLAEDTDLAGKLAGMQNVCFVPEGMDGFRTAFAQMYQEAGTLFCSDPDVGIIRYDDAGKTYVHVLNYAYSKEEDEVVPIETLKILLRELPGENVSVFTLDGKNVPCRIAAEGEETALFLQHVPVYTVIKIE